MKNLWIIVITVVIVGGLAGVLTLMSGSSGDNTSPEAPVTMNGPLPTLTPTPPAGIAPTPTVRIKPTPQQVMASKAEGIRKQGEVGRWMRETQNELITLRLDGGDTALIDAEVRQLNHRLSKAGYHLHSATDAASNQRAEAEFDAIQADLITARQEAGLPATPAALLDAATAESSMPAAATASGAMDE